MNVGLIVEGPTDIAVYSHLILTIRGELPVQSRPCERKVKAKFLGFLKEFENPAWRIEAAIVIADSDCRPVADVEKSLIDRKGAYIPPFKTTFFAIRCKLESWLLADHEAISRVARKRAKQGQVEAANDPLETKDAKVRFYRALSSVGLPAVPPVYAEIAQEVDFNILRRRCAQFSNFEKLLKQT